MTTYRMLVKDFDFLRSCDFKLQRLAVTGGRVVTEIDSFHDNFIAMGYPDAKVCKPLPLGLKRWHIGFKHKPRIWAMVGKTKKQAIAKLIETFVMSNAADDLIASKHENQDDWGDNV